MMENQRHHHHHHQQHHHHQRLILIPPPLQGHITPMLQLATILHSKGFSITIAHTKFNAPDPTNHPNFIFLPFSDGLSDSYMVSSNNFMEITNTLNTNCVAPLKELLVRMMMMMKEDDNNNQEKIACVIYDGLMYFTDSVARELNLPSVLFRTTSATNFLAYHSFHNLRINGFLPVQESWSLELVPEFEPLRFKDLPIFNLATFDVMLKQTSESLSVKPLGVIFNTVECLEDSSINKLKNLYKNRVFPIGPLHMMISEEDSSKSSFLKQDYSCISWLDKQQTRSVLYVSLGSIAGWNENELIEVACGLANSEQSFLWVIRPGTITHDVSIWMESLPENVKKAAKEKGHIVNWAPQREVLAHPAIGGFWSHCGWNSTLEGLCEGVPIMCQPCFGDQRVNSRLLCNVWKVGLEWSNQIERGEIESAVRRIMVSAEGKEMGERAVKLKDKIRVAMRETGSSHDALNGLVHSILSATRSMNPYLCAGKIK